MSTGPSKQELEMYWKNSRQYFDELAKHYQAADPEYYRLNIKPFYDNPFSSTYNAAGQSKSTGGGAKFVLVAIAFAVLAILGAAAFFFISKGDSVSKRIEEITSPTEQGPQRELKAPERNNENGTNPVEPKDETPENEELSDDDIFILGAKHISEKKYDKAVYELQKIKPGSKKYKEAQQLIESVKYLKKFNK